MLDIDHRIERLADAIIKCESDNRNYVWGDCDKDMPSPHYCKTFACAKKYHCKARGVAQYHKKTFYYHARLAEMPDAKWSSAENQKVLLKWCLTIGDCGHDWTCYRKLVEN